jgi:hypothetical protein
MREARAVGKRVMAAVCETFGGDPPEGSVCWRWVTRCPEMGPGSFGTASYARKPDHRVSGWSSTCLEDSVR